MSFRQALAASRVCPEEPAASLFDAAGFPRLPAPPWNPPPGLPPVMEGATEEIDVTAVGRPRRAFRWNMRPAGPAADKRYYSHGLYGCGWLIRTP